MNLVTRTLMNNYNCARVLIERAITLRKMRCNLLKLKNSLKNQTIICVGNGPSLTQEQVELASNFPVIATNRAYQLFSNSLFEHGGCGWIIINDDKRCLEVLPDLPQSFKNIVFSTYLPSSFHKIWSLHRPGWIYAPCKWSVRITQHGLAVEPDIKYEFSESFEKVYYPGKSVIFSAIQFAYFLGAAKIVLIGCDMDYSGAKRYSHLIKKERHGIGHLGNFNYIDNGKEHMIVCRESLSAKNVELLNATPSGAIKEIPHVTMNDLVLGTSTKAGNV